MIKYNDNELLYFISEKDEIALEIILNKYMPLINKRLNAFKINKRNYEDFYQECIMVLYNCVRHYRIDKNVSFYSYFDSSIQYTIKNTLKQEKDYFYNVILSDIVSLKDSIELEYPENEYYEEKDNKYNNENKIKMFNSLSKFEEKVYKMICDGDNINDISLKLNKEKRSIYNTISRIKKKIINMNESKINVNNKTENKSNNMNDNINGLSSLEQRIYNKFKLGYKPREISYLLRMDVVSVYNALKRVKIKIKMKSDKN